MFSHVPLYSTPETLDKVKLCKGSFIVKYFFLERVTGVELREKNTAMPSRLDIFLDLITLLEEIWLFTEQILQAAGVTARVQENTCS